MFFIPGIVIGIVTFPGVIVHELAHQLFCRLFRVPVFEVVYFRTENPLGYVLHEPPAKYYQSVLISIGPFIVNTLLGFLIALPASIKYSFTSLNAIDILLLYLGISIAMHAFPSTGDAQVLWQHIKSKETPLLVKILVTPIVGLIYVGALGSFVWLDAIYGVSVALGLPWLLMKFFL